jgi:hypothetical protein
MHNILNILVQWLTRNDVYTQNVLIYDVILDTKAILYALI